MPRIKEGQRIFNFPNGYGASVISDGYGRESGLLEIAVLDAYGRVTYSTPITDDVLGWQTEEEVQAVLAAIAALTPADIRAEEVRRKRAEIQSKRDDIAELEAAIAALEAEVAS